MPELVVGQVKDLEVWKQGEDLALDGSNVVLPQHKCCDLGAKWQSAGVLLVLGLHGGKVAPCRRDEACNCVAAKIDTGDVGKKAERGEVKVCSLEVANSDLCHGGQRKLTEQQRQIALKHGADNSKV